MSAKKRFTIEEAERVGNSVGVKWDRFDVEQFRTGMNVELEHGAINPATDVTNDDPIMTGKITLAHLNEFPDYHTRLLRMEEEAEKFYGKK